MKLRKKRVAFTHLVKIKHEVTMVVEERSENERFEGYVFDDEQALCDAFEDWSDDNETGGSLPTVVWSNTIDTELVSAEDIEE